MNRQALLRETTRDVRRAGGEVITVEQRANHVLLRNMHSRICRAIVPRGHARLDGHSWQNSRASLRRQLHLLPGETNGGRHAR